MITAINNENREAYRKLFEAAMADLNNGATINSLETYFSHIKSLLSLTKNSDSNYGRKYSILPVMNEDDYFNIDANARTIKVPDTFRKNGLGVQGDQTAETIYFKVNRYFDAMDLNNTDIYIQWENANGDKGLAKEWVRDIETYDDYMVFGWVLGDLITKEPGILKFSVRFVKTQQAQGSETKTITYSLNTLTAQAMINSSLDLAIGTANDSLNDMLAGNFENTTTVTDNEIEIFKFVYSFDNLLENGATLNESASVISADLDKDGNLNLIVSAYVDLGTLSYTIYKQVGAKPDPNGSDEKSKAAMEEYYDFTPDQNVDLDKVYYKKENGVYRVVSLSELGGQGAGIPENTLYERYGKYVLNAANKIEKVIDPNTGEELPTSITGHYYATAVSTTPNGMQSAPLVSTYRVLLSPPEKATFKTDLEIGGKEIDKDTLIPEVNIPAHNSEEYIWSIKRYGENEFTTLEDVTGNSYKPTEEAFYGVKVKTTRNLDSVITDDQLVYCATKAPTADDIEIGSIASSYKSGSTLIADASYVPINPIATPGLTYQWYVITGTDEDGNEIKAPIQDATSNEYAALAGQYRCEVTAHYNGLTYTKPTAIYNVV